MDWVDILSLGAQHEPPLAAPYDHAGSDDWIVLLVQSADLVHDDGHCGVPDFLVRVGMDGRLLGSIVVRVLASMDDRAGVRAAHGNVVDIEVRADTADRADVLARDADIGDHEGARAADHNGDQGGSVAE